MLWLILLGFPLLILLASFAFSFRVYGFPRNNASRWKLAGLIIALAVGMVLYGLLGGGGLSQTSALFIGLPAAIAVTLTLLLPHAKTVTGMILVGMTIALFASGIFLREGLICVLMAAPIFYLVGLIIGKVIDGIRRGSGERSKSRLQGLIILPFLLMSLEGTHDSLSFPREETVVVEKVVPASPTDVEATLGQVPNLDQELPLFLRLGFPSPIASSGSGLNPGDQRVVRFASWRRAAGDSTFEIADRSANRVSFRAVSDHSDIAHWLEWKEAEVQWTGQDSGHTLVKLTLRYQRRLDPAWYFGPLERYAVSLTAGYLIDAMATP